MGLQCGSWSHSGKPTTTSVGTLLVPGRPCIKTVTFQPSSTLLLLGKEGKEKAAGLTSENQKVRSLSHVNNAEKFSALFRIRICMLGLVSSHLFVCFTVSGGFL